MLMPGVSITGHLWIGSQLGHMDAVAVAERQHFQSDIFQRGTEQAENPVAKRLKAEKNLTQQQHGQNLALLGFLGGSLSTLI